MISVIIPVYNVDTYLKECLDSVISQSFKDLEIILIDDGSIDKSSEICDAYALKDERIRVFHKKNEGVSVARNIGLDNAHGEWVMFVDADDYLLPDSISRLLETANRDKSDIVFGNAEHLTGNVTSVMFDLKGDKTTDVLRSLPSLAMWGYLMRSRPLVDNTIRFVPGLAYSEDAVFLDEAALFYRQLSVVGESIYVYRDNPTSVCKSTKYERCIKHQFWAASLIGGLSEKYSLRFPVESRLIFKDGLSKICAGINVALNSNIHNRYHVTKSIFKEYYPDNSDAIFTLTYLRLYAIYHIKKIAKKLIARCRGYII